MPAKRRRAKKRANAITRNAVAAFKARDRSALDRALGLKPWEASPLDDIDASDASSGGPESPWACSIPKARELRAQLKAACGNASSDQRTDITATTASKRDRITLFCTDAATPKFDAFLSGKDLS